MQENSKERIINILRNCDDIQDSALYFNEITKLRPIFNQDQEKIRFLNLLSAFGNSDRLLILDSLRQKDRCVCEIEAIIDKTQPAVSHHLKILEEVHLIRGWKKGKFTHYSIVEKTLKEFEELWRSWLGGITNWFGVR